MYELLHSSKINNKYKVFDFKTKFLTSSFKELEVIKQSVIHCYTFYEKMGIPM